MIHNSLEKKIGIKARILIKISYQGVFPIIYKLFASIYSDINSSRRPSRISFTLSLAGGDLIKVEVNENIVMPAILLTEKAKGFKLDLNSGFNVVDFVALNQGTSGPNTAEIIVYDDQGKLVGTNRWNLATGVKATYIIYKK